MLVHRPLSTATKNNNKPGNEQHNNTFEGVRFRIDLKDVN